MPTILAISGLALVLGTVTFPDVTKDNLLVAVFGGFFLGAGIGLSVRGGAVIDGTEVLAALSPRARHAVVRLIGGSKVKVERSSRDPGRGHIVEKL